MIDIDRICLGCMQEKPTAGGECPYCGFDVETYEHETRWLPLMHILNGRYMLGKVLGEGGFGITYIGIDLNLQSRVAIKEYFPLGLVSRETTGLHAPVYRRSQAKKEIYTIMVCGSSWRRHRVFQNSTAWKES